MHFVLCGLIQFSISLFVFFCSYVLLVVGIGGLIGAMHEIKIERDDQFHSEYEQLALKLKVAVSQLLSKESCQSFLLKTLIVPGRKLQVIFLATLAVLYNNPEVVQLYRLSKAILDGPMFSKVKLLSSSKRYDEVLLANEQFEYPEGSCQPCGHKANCFAFPRVKERTIVYI